MSRPPDDFNRWEKIGYYLAATTKPLIMALRWIRPINRAVHRWAGAPIPVKALSRKQALKTAVHYENTLLRIVQDQRVDMITREQVRQALIKVEEILS